MARAIVFMNMSQKILSKIPVLPCSYSSLVGLTIYHLSLPCPYYITYCGFRVNPIMHNAYTCSIHVVEILVHAYTYGMCGLS